MDGMRFGCTHAISSMCLNIPFRRNQSKIEAGLDITVGQGIHTLTDLFLSEIMVIALAIPRLNYMGELLMCHTFHGFVTGITRSADWPQKNYESYWSVGNEEL